MSKKISMLEPADRPLMLAISLGEAMTLIKHHGAMIRRITNQTGKHVLGKPLQVQRDTIKAAQEMIDAHARRAKGIHSIIAGNIATRKDQA